MLSSSPLSRALEQYFKYHTDSKGPDIKLQAVHGLEILQLCGWKNAMGSLRKAIEQACEFRVEEFSGVAMACEDKTMTLLPLSFEKYQLICRNSKIPSSLLALPISAGVSLKLGHSISCLEIAGKRVNDFLPLLFTIDTDPNIFVAGQVAVTSYHHVSVTLHRLSEKNHTYHLYMPSSMAQSLCESIIETALQFKVRIKS